MKKRSIILVALVAVLIFENANSEESKIEHGKNQVKSLLKDPNSAEFKGVGIVINSKGEDAVCGEVNARNSYGGYVGFKKFVVLNEVATIVYPDKKETLKPFNLGGCAGQRPELLERLSAEATFNCNVIWTMFENIIVNNQTTDQTIKAAMHATNARAESNQATIDKTTMNSIENQYRDALQKSLSNKKFVDSIKKKNRRYGTKATWMASCIMQTNLALESQIQ